MWKFTAKGKEAVRIALMGNDDRSKDHTNDQVFKREIYGLTITQHIDVRQGQAVHGVMLIEGKLWDSAGVRGNVDQVMEQGFALFQNEAYYNLFMFHPELMKDEYIENLQELPCLKDNSMRGIEILSGEEFFKSLGL